MVDRVVYLKPEINFQLKVTNSNVIERDIISVQQYILA